MQFCLTKDALKEEEKFLCYTGSDTWWEGLNKISNNLLNSSIIDD